MSKKECKAAVLRLWEQAFNRGDMAVLDALCAPRHVSHEPGMPEVPMGPEGLKQILTTYRRSLSGARLTVETIFGQGDKVVVRWSAEPAGLPRAPRPTGTTVFRFEDGRLAETWSRCDGLGPIDRLDACVS